MRFINKDGKILEFTEKELQKLISEMVVTDIIKLPKDLNKEEYYFLDEVN